MAEEPKTHITETIDSIMIEEEVVQLAIFMHEEYERVAKFYGWRTNPSTRKTFFQLPASNARTMLHVASSVYIKLTGKDAFKKKNVNPEQKP